MYICLHQVFPSQIITKMEQEITSLREETDPDRGRGYHCGLNKHLTYMRLSRGPRCTRDIADETGFNVVYTYVNEYSMF